MKNKLYIVTGASNGFGKAIALNVLEQNQYVISLSRSLIPQSEIEMYAQTLFQFKIDFSKPFKQKTTTYLKKVISQIPLKQIDEVILINNAAIVAPVDRVEKLNEAEVSRHLQINLSAPIIMTQIFLDFFSKFKRRQTVVQITSGAAVNPVEGWGMYCAGKAGLNMFNQVLALQKREDHNFKTIGYSPGVMDTNMQKNIRAAKKKQFPQIDDFKRYKAEKQLRDVDDVTRDLLRVLSNASALISGQVYRVS